MKREIIVNAGDLQSRVAMVEDGQLAELLVEREHRIVGSIYKARVMSVLPGMDAAFADVGLDRNVFLSADDVGLVSRDGVRVSRAPRSASISQRLKENQEVVVQIIRAPVGGKGARAATRLAIPGRYLVLLVSHGFQVGVSRKIEARKERERLRKIGERIRPDDAGLIIRTEAEGHGVRNLQADLKVLQDLRDRIMKKAAQAKAPALLHQDLTLVYQIIRDVFTDDVSSLVIDEKSVYDNAADLVKRFAPRLRRRMKRYRDRMPIFHKHGIEGEIDRLLRRKVWLSVGGYISIDQAEAFTAIDVNTGRFTGSTGLADTILRTNLEAADEIARQLRLRDVGGIIVIDFIDMDRIRHRQRVMKAFDQALKRDRQKTKILHLSPLGLVEMTRKRRGESLIGILMETCPHCAGLGRVRRRTTIALKIERDACRLAAEEKPQAMLIRAAPSVADILIGEDGQRAASLEKQLGGRLYIRADDRFAVEDHQITPMTRAAAAKTVEVHEEGRELVLDHIDPSEPGADGEVHAWTGGYRVAIEGPSPEAEGETVVLTKADRSFGRCRLKRAAEPKKKREQPQPKRSQRKRRRPRRKSKASGRPAPKASASSPPKQAKATAEQRAPQPAAPKKSGLLRRGARRVARPRH